MLLLSSILNALTLVNIDMQASEEDIPTALPYLHVLPRCCQQCQSYISSTDEMH